MALHPLVFEAGCSRAGFEYGLLDMGPREQGVAVDGPVDGPPPHDLSTPGDVLSDADLALADAAAPRTLVCSPSRALGYTRSLVEPAISVDGLALFARSGATTYRATRATLDGDYEAWATYSLGRDGTEQDPSFFLWQGTEAGMFAGPAANGSDRELRFCTPFVTASCDKVVLQSGGVDLVGDIDGPSVALLADGPIMAFNVAPPSGDPGDIYLGRPTIAGDLLAWEASPVLALNSPDTEDDPVLSDDGLLVVFARTGGLWISVRATTEDAFPAPTRVVGADPGSGPELFTRPDGGLELYFHRRNTTLDQTEIQQADCALASAP